MLRFVDRSSASQALKSSCLDREPRSLAASVLLLPSSLCYTPVVNRSGGCEYVANLRSAIRDIRKSRKRAAHNQGVRSAMKTWMKKARAAITAGEAEATEFISATSSLVDKAAKRNIIHK